MKKLLTLMIAGLVTAAALSSCGEAKVEGGSRLDEIKKKGVITMATSPDFAPNEFEDISSGETVYAGCDIELGKYIADYLGVELQIEAMDFSAVQAAVTTGNVDMAISGFAYTEDRAESCEVSTFFNIDDNESTQFVIVPADKVSEYNSVEAFDGKLVACQNGSLQYNLTTEQLPNAEIEIISSLADGIMMVSTGKVDAMACSGEQAELYVLNYPDLGIAEWEFEYTSQGNILLCQKGETNLIAEINKAITEVNEKKLYSQWKAEATELAKSLGLEVNE